VKILSVVGTRPNFMKLAPLAHVLARRSDVDHVIVHTGQHYDTAMSDTFFTDLQIPAPKHYLAVGSGSHAAQTAAVLERIEPVLIAERPDYVLVYGDVNSTLAAAIAAAKLNIPVCHVEAGLRSRDRTMPEEINRVLTDHAADLLFAPSPDGVENLIAEGIPVERIHFVGNIMIDMLVHALPRAKELNARASFGVSASRYVVVTLHRPSNVDDPERLESLMGALKEVSDEATILFPVHPRTKNQLASMGFHANGNSRVQLLDPLSYTQMLGLVSAADLVITDSGGLQEETTYLGVPCLTVRPNTERPITCTHGTNRLIEPERVAIVTAARQALARRGGSRPAIDRWDGHTAERITAVLCDHATFN
jgi:UDP-N-acetylglucosamine 2-epimerase (non-hydrolysing)